MSPGSENVDAGTTSGMLISKAASIDCKSGSVDGSSRSCDDETKSSSSNSKISSIDFRVDRVSSSNGSSQSKSWTQGLNLDPHEKVNSLLKFDVLLNARHCILGITNDSPGLRSMGSRMGGMVD